ncbi:MAG: hypothetical protein MSA07_03400 [Mucispirillum sp.]|nr:hypothetical protein [Mucispirillum sp.]
MGGGNFVANLVWTNKEGGGSSDSKHFRIKHEYILVYSRYIDKLKINGIDVEDVDRYREQDKYINTRGPYQLIKLDSASLGYIVSLDFPIKAPDNSLIYPNKTDNKISRWRWSKDKVEWGIKNDFIVIKKDKNNEWSVYTKQYLNCDNEGNIKKRTIQPFAIIDKYSTTQSNKALNELLEKNIFSYSKPVTLIKLLNQISTEKNDIILDFFSGSATTAHAVMQLNAEDGGNRKYIMVQLPAETPEKSEARKAGYSTICEIGKERIRRAGEKIKKDYPNANIDTGFRVFKLDSSNMEDVYYEAEKFSQQDISKTISYIKADRSEEDLLFQIILSCGIPLKCKIEIKKVNNRDVYFVDDTYLIVCFEKDIDDKTIEELAKMQPDFMVFNQNVQDSTLANIKQIFKMISNDTNVKVI